MQLRLWSIPDQKVVSWQDVHEMVTAASYSPSGLQVVVGTMKGKCRWAPGSARWQGWRRWGLVVRRARGWGPQCVGGGECGWDVGVQGVSMAQSRAGRAPLSTAPTRCARRFYAIQDSSLEYEAQLGAWVGGAAA